VPFATNVFVNCPFDEEYGPMLQPLLFTIISVGLRPRIALESLDSGQPRIEKVLRLIRESRFGIHDLSRMQARRRNEIFRLNMPLELGIDFGCRRFGGGALHRKRCLILESERYRFQAAISDLSGSDIGSHDDQPIRIVSIVRDWLRNEAHVTAAAGHEIWSDFNEFSRENTKRLTADGFSERHIAALSVKELMEQMSIWLNSPRSRLNSAGGGRR